MSRLVRLGIGVILVCGIAAPASASETTAYNYDALGRVASVSRSGAVNNGTFESYSYDSAGTQSDVTAGTSASAPAFSIAGNSVDEGDVLTAIITKLRPTGPAVEDTYSTSNGTVTAGIGLCRFLRHAVAGSGLTIAKSQAGQEATITNRHKRQSV